MKRMLVLAHREELIWQAAAHARTAGLTAGVEMGNLREHGEQVVVSTVQTLNAYRSCRACRKQGCQACDGRGRYRRMETFNPDHFGLVIIDEAHHGTANSYRRIINHFARNPDLRVLGVTATPKRADGVGMHNVFGSVAYEMDLRTAIDEGWLCPIRQRFVTCDWLDLSEVATKAGGDLADGALEAAMLAGDERALHEIAKPTLDEAKGEPTLIFAAGKEHARQLTAAFNAYEGVAAECVIEDTDRDERKRIIERYKRRETQVLVGCLVFTEGFDAPGTTVVGVCRPTKSESLYAQMIGRGTRPLPGVVDGPETPDERRAAIAASGKPACLVLDFVGNSGRHKLVSVADVLAGNDVDPLDLEEAKAEAREAAEPVDMEQLVEKAKQARQEREERKREEAERRMRTRHRADAAEYTADDVDLFDARNFDAFSDYQPSPGGATQKQVNYLVKLGVNPNDATTYSKRQAGAVIDSLTRRTGGDFVMPFGKHRGKPLKDLPGGYRRWLAEKCDNQKVRDNLAVMDGAEPART